MKITRLGAKVVNGTLGKKNNYMPQSYFHFNSKWLAGASFEKAVQEAYQEARVYTEPVYRFAGLGSYVTDSRHRIVGEHRLGRHDVLARASRRRRQL